MKTRNIILSWDTFISIVVTLLTALILPGSLSSSFALSFYNVGITVLALIFSLFFAALAIIMTSSDNDFIEFLEQESDFTGLLDTFSITLIFLFISLVSAITFYAVTDYFLRDNNQGHQQHKSFFLVFEFLFLYSMIATGLSVKDTIAFSKRRANYLMQRKSKKDGGSEFKG